MQVDGAAWLLIVQVCIIFIRLVALIIVELVVNVLDDTVHGEVQQILFIRQVATALQSRATLVLLDRVILKLRLLRFTRHGLGMIC